MSKFGVAKKQPHLKYASFLGWPALGIAIAINVAFGLTPDPDSPATSSPGNQHVAQTSLDVYPAFVSSLTYSPDNTQLASATVAGNVWLKNMASGRTARIGQITYNVRHSLSFSADGRFLAAKGAEESIVHIWSLQSRTEVEELVAPNGECVAFSPDGRWLAVGCSDGMPILWEWPSRRRVALAYTPGEPIHSLAFSPSGTTLVTGHNEGAVKLWDIDGAGAGACVSTQTHATSAHVKAVAFSPDGTFFVTGSPLDRVIRKWDSATGQPRGTLVTMPVGLKDLAFSLDGKLLALSVDDGTAVLFSMADAQTLATLQLSQLPLQAVAFSNDGRSLTTGGGDGTVRTWDVARMLGAAATDVH